MTFSRLMRQHGLKRCGEKCSDQKITNEVYALVYDVMWQKNSGVSKEYNLAINVFRKTFVARSEINCYNWISTDVREK